jgi:hypothetical protein
VILSEKLRSATIIFRNLMNKPKTAENSQIKEKYSPVSYNLPDSIIAWIATNATKAGHKSRSEWLANFLKKARDNG